MSKEKKNVQQINIELDEKISAGEYANFVVVTHSPAEFVMDFTRILPGVPKAKVHSRIIMAPQHAKAYLAALNDNIKKFEAKNGEIKMPSRDELLATLMATMNAPLEKFVRTLNEVPGKLVRTMAAYRDSRQAELA